MNIYEFVVIDGKLVEISEHVKVCAHGADTAKEVEELFDEGYSMEEIRTQFCSYCYGKLPCGCDRPSPQG